MSAFIVENETINEIISCLISDYENVYFRERLKSHFNSDLGTLEGRQELGKQMLSLNIAAVEYRYDLYHRKKEPEETFQSYVFSPILGVNKIKAAKALSCFLYQCTEGEFTEKPLFKILDEIKNAWFSDIVNTLPEYKNAPWG